MEAGQRLKWPGDFFGTGCAGDIRRSSCCLVIASGQTWLERGTAVAQGLALTRAMGVGGRFSLMKGPEARCNTMQRHSKWLENHIDTFWFTTLALFFFEFRLVPSHETDVRPLRCTCLHCNLRSSQAFMYPFKRVSELSKQLKKINNPFCNARSKRWRGAPAQHPTRRTCCPSAVPHETNAAVNESHRKGPCHCGGIV